MPLDNLTSLSALGSGAGAALADNTPATSTSPATATTSGPAWLGGKLAQVSFIVLGLLLIAAGIFSFDKTREVIVKAGKTAGEAAAA